MKIRGTISSGLDFDKCYLDLDSEQYLIGFNHQSDTLCNVNAGGIVTFKPYNSKNT